MHVAISGRMYTPQGSEIVHFTSPPTSTQDVASAYTAPQSPEISTLASWMDLIDELIELPPESIISSSPTDPTSSTSLSPSSTSSFESLKRQKVKECSTGDAMSDHRSNPLYMQQSRTPASRSELQYSSGNVQQPVINAPPQLNHPELRTSPKRPYPTISHSLFPAPSPSNPQPIRQRPPTIFGSAYCRISSPKQSFYSGSDISMFEQSPSGNSNYNLPTTTHLSPSPGRQTGPPTIDPMTLPSQPNSTTLPQHCLQQVRQNDMVHSIKALRRSQSDEIQASGLRLVHLLLACAEAVSMEDYLVAKDLLLQLQQTANVNGDSMQRIAAYFTNALHSRLSGTGQRSYMALRTYDPASCKEILTAYQIFYEACPYIKFSHFSSNQAIFEAFDGEENVHILDLHMVGDYQWPAFIQALAARPGGAPHLRITGVGIPLEVVQETGKRLTELAESLHVPFEFHAVGERLEDLKPHMLQRRIGEALAVNSVNRLHRLLSEPGSPLFAVLHMIREQGPTIFTVVEQEASHNGQFFLGRFLEALHYYSAIFDSVDATLPQNSPDRTKVEHLIFGQEITNIVACEGSERIERHQKLDKWRKVMEGVGFQSVPLSATAVNQARLLLGLYPCEGYTLEEDKGCLLLGWQDRPIVAASAWRC